MENPMTQSTKLIIGCYAVLIALAFLWVPWTAAFDPLDPMNEKTKRELFLGYGWFWAGPRPHQYPFDYVAATRKKWNAPVLDDDDIRALKSLVATPRADVDKAKSQTVGYFIDKLRPSITSYGNVLDPDQMPADVMEQAKNTHTESGLLALANGNQVLSWLKVKENWDRTFPDRVNMSQERLVQFLDIWHEEVKEENYRRFAIGPPGLFKVKYPFIALEFLSLVILAAATIALKQACIDWQRERRLGTLQRHQTASGQTLDFENPKFPNF